MQLGGWPFIKRLSWPYVAVGWAEAVPQAEAEGFGSASLQGAKSISKRFI
jgi:hypothetical protein